MTVTIDLSELTKNEVRLLSGHPRGLAARELFKLDQLDALDETVKIVAPNNLEAITTSFVQGFLSQSLGSFQNEENLRAHYEFELTENLKRDFDQGIKRLLISRKLASNSQ